MLTAFFLTYFLGRVRFLPRVGFRLQSSYLPIASAVAGMTGTHYHALLIG
jgi:hypothetical protein